MREFRVTTSSSSMMDQLHGIIVAESFDVDANGRLWLRDEEKRPVAVFAEWIGIRDVTTQALVRQTA